MTVTMKDIPAIINELKKRKPTALAKDSDRPLSPKEAIMQLAPTLIIKREEGFTTAGLVDFLAKHHISVKAHNLTRYLREYGASATTIAPLQAGKATPEITPPAVEAECDDD